MRLLTKLGGNAKLRKGTGGFAPFILHLAPAGMGGRGNVCPGASPECIALCLNYSGRAMMEPKNPKQNRILGARVRKTQFLFDDSMGFLNQLKKEIRNAIRLAGKKGLTPVFRLNGTSDLIWEDVIREFPNVQFYDYTKNPVLYNRYLLEKLPSNYHLTFSFSGRNRELCESFLMRGGNVAMAFARPIGQPFAMPQWWGKFPVYDGDKSDLRFLDPVGAVIGLKAKGMARKVTGNPFVVGS